MKIYNIFVLLLFMVATSAIHAQIRIQPSLGFGIQKLNFKSDIATVDGTSGITLGANAFYELNEDMFVGSGFAMMTYGADATINYNYEAGTSSVDMDGDSYFLSADFNGVKEKYRMTTIEIPILFKYQRWVSPDILLTGTTGPVFILPGGLKSEFVSGNLATSGYYPEWNLTIDDIPEYGFSSRTLSSDMPDYDLKPTFGWTLQVGAEYYLAKRLNLTATLYYQTGFGSVVDVQKDAVFMADPSVYNGSMYYSDKVTLSSVGIKVGLLFDLTPPEKAGVKSIR